MRPIQRLAALPLLLLFAACQTTVTTPPADCSGLIPPSWRVAVKGYALPPADRAGDAKEWQIFGVGQTGQLSKESGQKLDIIFIYSECEKRANAARPRKRILGVF